MRYLPSGRIQRFRLALASKPYDVFFLCHVPSREHRQQLERYELAGLLAGQDALDPGYQPQGGRRRRLQDRLLAKDQDAFPEPNWPKQTLDELILVTFTGRMIDQEDHPGLLRLIGAKQSMS